MSLRTKYIIYLLLLNTVLITALLLSWNVIFESTLPFVGIATVMGVFFLYEIVAIWFTEKKSETITPRQSINLFLGLKAGKIILSLLLITVYMITINIELKRFIFSFVALYLAYLLFDTYYLASREKKNKKNKN